MRVGPRAPRHARSSQLLRADASDCYLYDAERGTLRCCQAVFGFPDVHASRPRVRLRRAGPRGASRSGAPVLMGSDYGHIGGRAERRIRRLHGGRSWRPITLAAARCSGVLGVCARGGVPFRSRDVDVLEAFAGLASLALAQRRELRVSASGRRRSSGASIRIAAGARVGRCRHRDAGRGRAGARPTRSGGASARRCSSRTVGSCLLSGSHELPRQLATALQTGLERGDGPLVRAAAQEGA